ncbi:C6 transcription factor, putative [Talaromyces stipitatus ATCC 10500]|uniref:C6 transcription factor, putative n=1 Tax=Talaromyces stipitatus (strain ATCC 10500 / CBS 375.48 / QM 6759 / NRRL 1006) TaxID=441959 RepID=B8M4T5_TALSN|nr:C6 transcription factor, putative [Talaromyces stipitatus ATCC 10500]EED19370.1 C6 transcription factor, putative [Talaromyces stipitatus ATCC 10500]
MDKQRRDTMDTEIASSEAAAGGAPRWRISKACQQCRRRKIRCDGGEPCQHCKQKKLECEYRGFVRQRKRKHELLKNEDAGAGAGEFDDDDDDEGAERDAQASASGRGKGFAGSRKASRSISGPGHGTADGGSGRRNDMVDYSVAATHVASPSCVIQLYYGPHSNFSLMQLMYRQLVDGLASESNNNSSSTSRRDEVEEVGPGLDLFSFRRLFFGDLAGNQDTSLSGGLGLGSNSLFFMHPSTASKYLERFLSTIYYLTPWKPKDRYRQMLKDLYQNKNDMSSDSPQTTSLILMMAIGAAEVKDYEMGDILYKKAKANAVAFDEIVNVQTIQVPISEKARPNSAFLCLGTAIRKALAAGLHKNTRFKVEQTTEDAEEKRLTFWSLFFYDIWICFGLGRSMTIPAHEITIPSPKENPMLLALVEIARIMARATRDMYNQRHDSLLLMWKSAREIRKEGQAFARRVQGVLNFGIDASPKTGEVGVCQIVLQLLYHSTMLLTFRPFLVFRARWRRDGIMKQGETLSSGSEKGGNIPPWLDEACESCLEAARCMIRNLSGACQINQYVREITYHGFMLETSCFTLAFDMMHSTPQAAEKHLPWVRSGLRCLSTLLPIDNYQGQIHMTMNAIQQMLIAVFPELSTATGPDLSSPSGVYDRSTWEPDKLSGNLSEHNYHLLTRHSIPNNTNTTQFAPNNDPAAQQAQSPYTHQRVYNSTPSSPTALRDNSIYTNPSTFFTSLGQNLMATPGSSADSNNANANSISADDNIGMVDFTQDDIPIDWKDFDLSTMDLETFMSIDPVHSSAANINNQPVDYFNGGPTASHGVHGHGHGGWPGNDFGFGHGR